jgi:Mg-chelatase subunit ChlD
MASIKAISDDDMAAFAASSGSAGRAPVDILCCVDRSGSMAGEKLELVKVALRFMLTQLKSTDRMGIVTYDDNVATNLPPAFVNKEFTERAERIIDEIVTGGSTNLSGGLFEGVRHIRQLPPVTSNTSKDRVASVFLFTDGLANAGLQTLEQIKPVLSSMLAEKATVFTFALGSDHNETMLKGISEVGQGMYYFFQRAEDIPIAFADSMGGLLSVCAQNLSLEIKVMDDDVSIVRVLTRFPVTNVVAGKHVRVSVRDIYADESRDILVEVKLPARSCPVADDPVFEVKLDYTDIVRSCMSTATSVLKVTRGTVKSEANVAVDEQRNRFLVAETLEQANALGQQGELEQAQSRLQAMKASLQAAPSAQLQSNRDLQQQIDGISSQMRSRHEYQQYGSKMMAQCANEHYYQRSATSNYVPDGATASGPSSVSSNAYATKSKSAMRSAAFQASPNLRTPASAQAQTPSVPPQWQQAPQQMQMPMPASMYQQQQQRPMYANVAPPRIPSKTSRQRPQMARSDDEDEDSMMHEAEQQQSQQP